MTVHADRPEAIFPIAPPAAASIWRLAVKQATPIVRLNESRSGPSVYCIHPITGDVVGLRILASHLVAPRLYGIQVPKDDMNGAFPSSIEAMASRYVALITAFQPEGPITLVGWSAGSVIALEMAQQFSRLGRTVPLLVALDGAPSNTRSGLAWWRPSYIAKLVLNVPRWIRDDLEQDWSWRGILRRLETKLAYRFGVGVTRVPSNRTCNGEAVQTLLDTKGWLGDQKAFIHGMYMATTRYVPRPYTGPVLVFETRTQPLIRLRQIAAAWKAIAPGAEIVSIDGNHSKIVDERAMAVIAGHLLDRLETR